MLNKDLEGKAGRVREEHGSLETETKPTERKIRFADDEVAREAGEYVLERYAEVFRRLAQ